MMRAVPAAAARRLGGHAPWLLVAACRQGGCLLRQQSDARQPPPAQVT